jgi:hypothetical protein
MVYLKKYYIEPPKNISQLPLDFIKLEKKFKKRAYRELLELCNQILSPGGAKLYQGFFTIQGTPIQSLDQVTEDDKFLLASEDPSKGFKGLYNSSDVLGHKELRYENAVQVKKRISSLNREWAN